VSPNPWIIGAAGGTTDGVYADMYTVIVTMIGDTVSGGGTGGSIATGTKEKRLSGETPESPLA
jgi:hypothetical protein